MDELLNSNYTAVIATLSKSWRRGCSMVHNRIHTFTRMHVASPNHCYLHTQAHIHTYWLLLTLGDFGEAASILSSKINMLVSLFLWCVGAHVCVCVCLEMRFTFWSERGFTGPWVDRSMLSGRHTLSRAGIALERPQQSV